MAEKTVREAIAYRRSVRVYDPEQPIDPAIVKDCIEQATLAPTSSNLQLWEFYHITSTAAKEAMVKACLSQTASRTAQQFVVAVSCKDKWKERQKPTSIFKSNFLPKKERQQKEKMAKNYYTKIIPTLYTDFLGIMGPFKRLLLPSKVFLSPCTDKYCRVYRYRRPKKYRFGSTKIYA